MTPPQRTHTMKRVNEKGKATGKIRQTLLRVLSKKNGMSKETRKRPRLEKSFFSGNIANPDNQSLAKTCRKVETTSEKRG